MEAEVTVKEKLINALGVFGVILYYLFAAFIYVIPFVMIGISFWWGLLFFFILEIFPVASIVFWVWGLVCAINGVQDAWAIIYYILFAVMFLPFFVALAVDLFSGIISVFQKE